MPSKQSLHKNVAIFLTCLPLAYCIEFNYPAAFNFGDSNSDTGGIYAAFGGGLNPPYGQTFNFHEPLVRFSDGRLLLDFLNSKAAERRRKYLPAEEYFEKGLYMFDIGQNDIIGRFHHISYEEVLTLIPNITSIFEDGLKELYDQGARNFWIHNMGPVGCIPMNIVPFGTDPSNIDDIGCLIKQNKAAKSFNRHLLLLCKKLKDKLRDAKIIYVDVFTIKYNVTVNHSKLGFEQGIKACCGIGGPPLNYNTDLECGRTKMFNGSLRTARECDDSSVYVNWDGSHYTDAANKYTSSQILTGKYFDPPQE
ncbi:hypothetical protein RJ640_025044 [Escallonia rubra]|uniref:GDSL esterase/lipase n=1 Tax=Escallonia rubra TaxID=112253 RepID=A0AA88UWG2_9ASTE|nr:hypothetical protein RJ640_028532 [Escallonia rubra]KAK2993887.1 hypothetical protein RJ640_025044 [Escallonia rubra]